MSKPIYVLGTGLSHNGSACLLKDGKICVAIEKERLSRIKHDGHNDSRAITYCLNAADIDLSMVDLVVQNAVVGTFKFGNDYFGGDRLFTKDVKVPVVTISHHLAHAYSSIGTSPMKDQAVLVIDGMGSPMDECMDLDNATIAEIVPDQFKELYAEKDSFYLYRDGKLSTIYKDFSMFHSRGGLYPMHPRGTKHSIGGLYSALSSYVFGNMDDAGKLMGLAPYGRKGVYDFEMFSLQDGRLHVNYDWMLEFKTPARTSKQLKENFQYYADIAYWTQREVERAVNYLICSRSELCEERNLAYTGGVALNAVANGRICEATPFKRIYITPAAGDNGIAIGCAYYGWLEVLKKKRAIHNGNIFFGKPNLASDVEVQLKRYVINEAAALHIDIEESLSFLPFSLNGGPKDLNYKISFDVKDTGIFSVHFYNESCTVTNRAVTNPDCKVETDGPSMIKCLRNPNYFFGSKLEGATTVKGDLDVFIRRVDLAQFSQKVNERIQSSHVKKPIFHFCYNITVEVARMLANGKVVAWYQEGSEFGPRALGHRSILADPRKSGMKDFINSKIKFREDFRPFAPAVLQEDASRYFEFQGDSPYMLMVAKVREEWAEKIPSVVHKDLSARLQTVTPDWNKKFYDLLVQFKHLTGIPILLNTSLNKKGMPIVETIEDALNMFYDTALDYLVIDSYIISKEVEN